MPKKTKKKKSRPQPPSLPYPGPAFPGWPGTGAPHKAGKVARAGDVEPRDWLPSQKAAEARARGGAGDNGEPLSSPPPLHKFLFSSFKGFFMIGVMAAHARAVLC